MISFNEFKKLEYPYTFDGQDHYDLYSAVEHNSIELPEKFEIVLELLSEEHDEGEYYWLLKDDNNYYYVVTGSHDYTGWDCQSGASISEPFGIQQLPLYAPEYDNQNRPIRRLMLEAVGAGSGK